MFPTEGSPASSGRGPPPAAPAGSPEPQAPEPGEQGWCVCVRDPPARRTRVTKPGRGAVRVPWARPPQAPGAPIAKGPQVRPVARGGGRCGLLGVPRPWCSEGGEHPAAGCCGGTEAAVISGVAPVGSTPHPGTRGLVAGERQRRCDVSRVACRRSLRCPGDSRPIPGVSGLPQGGGTVGRPRAPSPRSCSRSQVSMSRGPWTCRRHRAARGRRPDGVDPSAGGLTGPSTLARPLDSWSLSRSLVFNWLKNLLYFLFGLSFNVTVSLLCSQCEASIRPVGSRCSASRNGEEHWLWLHAWLWCTGCF